MTTPTRYRRLRELFHQLVDLDLAEREEKLRELDAGELEDELRALLAAVADEEEDDRPLVLIEPPGEEPGLPAGHRLGPWQIDHRIGHGGMGSVYLAHRADGAYDQKAAVKVIRAGPGSRRLLVRFRAERQALADLSHPNIARLLDGGQSENGQPFLVMEYVDGVDLERHCRLQGLGLEARLELFEAVSAAVEYAHGHLVVHRDLKPGNILVDAEGVPKLLDFGIAKLLDVPRDEETRALTGALGPLGTVDFASPEQLRGEPVTTATDVYSLGVVLYRLVTGRHPYPVDDVPITEAIRRVCEVDPPAPSHAAAAAADEDARRRSRELRGDLDSIVMTALRKEPARRYPSVAAMAEDLRRYREGLPVSARQASRRYRAGKFLRRHRLALAAALLVLSSLVGGLVATRREASLARQAAHAAEVERQKAARVSEFLEQILASPNANWRWRGGANVTVIEMLAEAGERLDRDLADQPEVEARLRQVLGATYTILGQAALAEKNWERALALDLRLYGQDHPDTARAYAVLGWLAAGHRGDFARGAGLMDRALAIYEHLEDPPAEDYVEALAYRARIFIPLGHFVEARQMTERAVAIGRAELPDHPSLAVSLTFLAILLESSGDSAAAEEACREALATFARLPNPISSEQINARAYLGLLLINRGELDEAGPLLQEALADGIRLIGPDNPSLIDIHVYLGLYHRARGDLGAARREIDRAWEIVTLIHAESNLAGANVRTNLGLVLADHGEHSAAEREFRQAAVVFARYPGSGRRLAQTELALAGSLVAQGRFAEAEAAATAGYERSSALVGEAHPATQKAVRVLVELYEAWGKPAERATWAALLDPR